MRALAQRLRALREEIGATSQTLADLLRQKGVQIEATRLSRFLNGREVPGWDLLKALHQVHADATSTDYSDDDYKATRNLCYLVLESRSRVHKQSAALARAQDDLEATQVATAAELTALREELRIEQLRRHEAEATVERLVAEHREREQSFREAAGARDAARQRVAELEAEIREREGLLRLLSRYAEHFDAMSEVTAAEIALVEGEVTQLPENCFELAELVEKLGDEGDEDEANRIVDLVIRHRGPVAIFDLWAALNERELVVDGDRLLSQALQLLDGLALFRLYRVWAEETNQGSSRRDNWLAKMIGRHSPIETVADFAKACRRRNLREALDGLKESVLQRSLPERTELHERTGLFAAAVQIR